MILHELADNESSYQALTEKFVALANTAVAARRECSVSLSGGKSPRPFYQKLNQAPLPWKQIWWFLGDERWVPKGHALSNETMVRASLGLNRPEFDHTFLSWYAAGNPELAAKFYQEKITSTLGDPPALDLALLGLGEDGHTLSLFPGTAALQETKRYAVANHVPQSADAPQRLTMTYPALKATREIWFLVTGASKAAMIDRLMKRDQTIPSAGIDNPNQHIYWLK